MYFSIKKSAPGRYWWRIVSAGNHEILASSEILSSKQACLHAISIVQGGAYNARIFDETGENA